MGSLVSSQERIQEQMHEQLSFKSFIWKIKSLEKSESTHLRAECWANPGGVGQTEH